MLKASRGEGVNSMYFVHLVVYIWEEGHTFSTRVRYRQRIVIALRIFKFYGQVYCAFAMLFRVAMDR